MVSQVRSFGKYKQKYQGQEDYLGVWQCIWDFDWRARRKEDIDVGRMIILKLILRDRMRQFGLG
jgi:hypothetical protein